MQFDNLRRYVGAGVLDYCPLTLADFPGYKLLLAAMAADERGGYPPEPDYRTILDEDIDEPACLTANAGYL